MSDVVIRAESLSKRYRIGERERYLTLRDVLARAASAPVRLFRARKPSSPNGDPTHIWALKDVSFEVRQGEVVGIIGRNGAGKTTLLKILARVTKPTQGCAEVRGRMGSLLEVGTGFHPELTGRENVFLSGAILGMSKAEIHRKFDEIVAFSEVEKFIDTPLKHYSTGMQMRLAFAVAAHLEPEILLVDEVLAVGDVAFQKKCLGKMGDVAKTGRTILFVSHNMGAVGQLCHRCFLLDKGQVALFGQPDRVIAGYLTEGATSGRISEDKWERVGTGKVRITSVEVFGSKGGQCSTFSMGDEIGVRVGGSSEEEGVEFSLSIQLMTNTDVPALFAYDQFKTFRTNGRKFLIELKCRDLMLMPGVYHLRVWIGRAGFEHFDWIYNAATIDVVQSRRVPISLPIEQEHGLVYTEPQMLQLL
jgi:lipopolysaccharide transport system ATP-binding protein